MDKITLKLTNKDWLQLTAIVLKASGAAEYIPDKYLKAICANLLKAVYIKLHNKMHSLKPKNNSLSLTLPEAANLAGTLGETDTVNVLVVEIIGIIDRSLT